MTSELPLIAQEEEENGIGDVDLFTLVDEGGGLEVNAKWLQHLQERLLGEDGHPRKVCLLHARAATGKLPLMLIRASGGAALRWLRQNTISCCCCSRLRVAGRHQRYPVCCSHVACTFTAHCSESTCFRASSGSSQLISSRESR